jgi:DNA-binding transcriptional MerR regulator
VSFTIGQAAAQARVAASTLRYWERQGLLNPARSNSQRRYDREDMRRAALLKLAGELQLPLATSVAILDGAPADRQELAEKEMERLDDLIERARGAKDLLANARDCPHNHPASQCPSMQDALDCILNGGGQSLREIRGL